MFFTFKLIFRLAHRVVGFSIHVKTALRKHPTPIRMVIIKKKMTTKAGEDMRAKKSTFTVRMNVNWCTLYGNQHGSFS